MEYRVQCDRAVAADIHAAAIRRLAACLSNSEELITELIGIGCRIQKNGHFLLGDQPLGQSESEIHWKSILDTDSKPPTPVGLMIISEECVSPNRLKPGE